MVARARGAAERAVPGQLLLARNHDLELSMLERHVVWFEDVGMGDVPEVGGKNASLGEMTRSLTSSGVRVPDGFATTAAAYRVFVEANGIDSELRQRIQLFRAGEASLRDTGEALRALILNSSFPDEIAETIVDHYRLLAKRSLLDNPPVAVRSSATAEDLPDASFAGQQESFLNVVGEAELLDACRRCYASLFTDRAISYREMKNFDHLSVALSIGVQQMVRSDAGASGVMFSIDTESGFPRAAVISAAWGLGETVVQGRVDPDKYLVFKPLLAEPSFVPIIEKTLGSKALKMVYSQSANARTRTVDTSGEERQAFVLSDAEIILLARWALLVEGHYGCPMDMEWAKDGLTGEIYMVQARPETVQARKSSTRFTVHRLLQGARCS